MLSIARSMRHFDRRTAQSITLASVPANTQGVSEADEWAHAIARAKRATAHVVAVSIPKRSTDAGAILVASYRAALLADRAAMLAPGAAILRMRDHRVETDVAYAIHRARAILAHTTSAWTWTQRLAIARRIHASVSAYTHS